MITDRRLPGLLAARTILLAALLAGLAVGLGPASVPAARAAGCTAWPTSYEPPPTIRVLRTATGAVEVVPFRDYVERVLAAEWPASYPTAALRVGAIAVKQYAWYYAIRSRAAYVTASGACYDVRDDSRDQIYDPGRSVPAATRAAVEATWSITLRKSGTFFLSGYGPGTVDACGADLSTTRTRLSQRGVRACALDGLDVEKILRTYLDPGLSIDTAGRLFGRDRFETAAAVARASFPNGARTVLLATGLDFPDALAAGPAAARTGAPILLTFPDRLPAPTAAEIARLQPERVLVLGGPAAVGEAVAEAVRSLGPTVERIAGPDRYATAIAISQAAFPDGAPIVLVATGRNFPDALVGAAAGAALGGPVLLVPGETLPPSVAAEIDRLGPERVWVLGGPTVVAEAVVAAIAEHVPDVVRLAGPDRYGTAVAVAAETWATGPARLRAATGLGFPDALAAAATGEPLLLVPPTGVPAVVAAEIVRLAPDRIVAVGGPAVLPDAVVSELEAARRGD